MFYPFIASRICVRCHNALTEKISTHRSNEAMACIDNFKKNSYISVVSVAKPKNIIVFAFTYVLESFACLLHFLHEFL